MLNGVRVVKVGGNELDDAAWVQAFAAAAAAADAPLVVVHGGGKEVSEVQRLLGAEPEWCDGLRVTTPEALTATRMVLSGLANKRLVGALVGAGVDAVGLSGEDGGLLNARIARGGALGRTGEVESVRAELLLRLLAAGLVPVLSPVSRGPDGDALNVNADDAAAAVAEALGACELLLVSNVPGVLSAGAVLQEIGTAEVEVLIAEGIATGGMAPKLRAAARTVAAGVGAVRIGTLEMLAAAGAGTRLMASAAVSRRSTIEDERLATQDPRPETPMSAAITAADALLGTYRPSGPVFVGGEGAHLIAEDGTRYLDFTSGIAVNSLGYGDAEVADAVRQALEAGLIHTSNLFRTRPAAELAAWLVEHSFAGKVFFCNSGAEANEGAFKFARRWSGKTEIVAFRGGFHGRTAGALAATDRPAYQEPFRPLMPGVRFCEVGDAAEADRLIHAERTAAVIIEPIQGEGGVLPVDPQFLKTLRYLCDEAGAALIFDEVQVGLGRTGTLWAYEAAGVVPDMLTLAKPLAGGLPMGAVLLAEKVAATIQPGDHATTFGGGPLVASAALAVCRKIGAPEFLAEVRRKAHLLANLLGACALRNPRVAAVRGSGMLWGVELNDAAGEVVARALEAGLLLCTAGTNVVRIAPPLTCTDDELQQGVALLSEAL